MNICASAETFMVSLKPNLMCTCLRPQTFSNGLLRETGEWVINFPSADILWQVDYCGQVSGRDVDKFAATGLTPLPALHVRAPLIKECPINVECRVRELASFGSHDLFVGDILAIHADEEVLDEEERPNPRLMRVVALCNREYWQPSTYLARLRFSQSNPPGTVRGLAPEASPGSAPGKTEEASE